MIGDITLEIGDVLIAVALLIGLMGITLMVPRDHPADVRNMNE
jgi:hypothetical protein